MFSLHRLADLLLFPFGGDVPSQPLELHQVFLRAVVVYVVGLAIVRVGKSRLLARITPLDVLLGFILGSVLGRAITGSASLSGTAAACVALVATHWVLTLLACRWHWFGDLVKGHAHLIVQDGEPLWNNMRGSHISIHDLDEALRLKGIDDMKQVRLAFKERSGEISVLTRK
jgi:uncharacterized membrane protein YcaP (DUF421 family)